MWNWFLSEGDKTLAGITLVLLALQNALPPGTHAAAIVTAILALVHTLAAPAPAPAPPPSAPKAP